MSKMFGTELNPDVEVEREISHNLEPSSGFKTGLGVQPTQPPHPLLEIGITTPDVSGLSGIYGCPSTSGRIDAPCGIFGSHVDATSDATPGGVASPPFRVSSIHWSHAKSCES